MTRNVGIGIEVVSVVKRRIGTESPTRRVSPQKEKL